MYDSGLERVYDDSLEEETSSLGSLDALISNVGKRIHWDEVFMPPTSCRKRRYEPICKGGNTLEASSNFVCEKMVMRRGIEVLEHLNIRSQPDVLEYDLVDAKVTSTSSIISTEVALSDANIMVDDHSKWVVLPLSWKKRICNSCEDCMALFYECLFTRIGIWMPFFQFEAAVVIY